MFSFLLSASGPFWPHPNESVSKAGRTFLVLCMGPLWYTKDYGFLPGPSLGSKAGEDSLSVWGQLQKCEIHSYSYVKSRSEQRCGLHSLGRYHSILIGDPCLPCLSGSLMKCVWKKTDIPRDGKYEIIMHSLAPSRNWRLRFLSSGFIREGLILCPLVILFQWPWLSSVNLNENIQAWYAQSQPWLTHCFHFYLEALFYVYQALTVSAHWCWFTDASFIHSLDIIYCALNMVIG